MLIYWMLKIQVCSVVSCEIKMKYESQIMVKLSDGNLTDAYLEYLRNELQSVEAESAKVSEEIERLSQSHALGSSLVFFY